LPTSSSSSTTTTISNSPSIPQILQFEIEVKSSPQARPVSREEQVVDAALPEVTYQR